MKFAIFLTVVAVAGYPIMEVPKGVFLYHMNTRAVKYDFLGRHNYYRARVTPSAANMRRLEWDDELAAQSKKFVRDCSFFHSFPPLHTSEFPILGENLYAGDEFVYSHIGYGATDTWYNETQYYDIDRHSTCDTGQECGHYKQLVWAETRKMGCAVAKCGKIAGGHGSMFVACHYGPAGNVFTSDLQDLPPYIKGPNCDKCPEDAPHCIGGLCVA